MNEYSSNAGGLIRWPVFALLPLGFALLGIQAVSELIKRIAFLKGLIARPDAEAAGQDAPKRSWPNSCAEAKSPRASRRAGGQAMMEFIGAEHGADHVRAA